jgi:hypothetical protein
MRSMNATKVADSCVANNSNCNGVCTDYRTQPECPPLIVLAMLATPFKDAQNVHSRPNTTRRVTRSRAL